MKSYPHWKRIAVKKMPPNVDNLSESEVKRRELIKEIQGLHNAGEKVSTIIRITGKDRRTVTKYLEGNPDILCRSNKRSALADKTDAIITDIKNGMTASEIAKKFKNAGALYTESNIRQFISKVAKENALAISKYVGTGSKYNKDGSRKPDKEYVTRKGIFNHLWMNIPLSDSHHEALWKKYKILPELESCIREFREIFEKKNMPCLYIFIERYQKSSIKEVVSFANGLAKDVNAVENAVASPLSNGFVEGTNSKVKTIKKAMYGRCGKMLLAAKLMYEKMSDN